MKSYIAKTGGGAAYIGQRRQRRRRHGGLRRAGVGVGLLVIEMLHVYRRIRHLLRASIPLTFKASKMMRSRAQATTTPSRGRGVHFGDRRRRGRSASWARLCGRGGSSKKLMILPTNNAVIARDKLTSLNLLRTTDKLRTYAVQCVLVRMP